VDQCSAGKPICVRARDCGGGYECLDATSQAACGASSGNTSDCCCIKVICTSNDDCDTPATCDTRRGMCVVPACNPAIPASCPAGKRCVNGTDATGRVVSTCQDVGAAGADTCVLDVGEFSLRAGDTRTLRPTGFSNAGAQVPYASFTFSSTASDKASVDASTGVVTGVATGEATIRATPLPSGTPCDAKVNVYGPADAGTARAIVFNARTGKPMAGVKVLLRKASTSEEQTTGANGAATFAATVAADIKDITAYPAPDAYAPAGYSWVTFTSPGTADLAFYVDPIPDPAKVAGVTGTFDLSLAQPPKGDIKLGIAAFSIAGALSDLSLEGLAGKLVSTDIHVTGIGDYEDVPMPSGLFLMLNNESIKSRIDMYAEGPCTAEAKCNRVLWGLGGQVGLSKISSIIQEVAGTTAASADPAKLLGAVLPFFRKFYHYTQGGLALVDQAAPTGENAPAFSQSITVKPAYLLSQVAPWTIPTLPQSPLDSTKYLSGALVLTGVHVPGQGVVPLGVTAGLDECAESDDVACSSTGAADGKVTCQDDKATAAYNECEGLSQGDIQVDYAPPHDGLEGNRFGTVAIALDIAGVTSGAMYSSILVSFNDTLSNSTGTKNTFPAGSFLGFNKGSFTKATRVYAGTTRIDGADFMRLTFSSGPKNWFVYAPQPPAGTFTVELPPLASGLAASDERLGEVIVQAFKLFSGAGQPATYTALAELNSTNADNLILYTAGFSANVCGVIYPARTCAADADCEVGYTSSYVCNTTAGLCHNPDARVTVKGSADCPAGTRPLPEGTPTICSQVPACEYVP
jgi:hypothetical protein